MYVQVTYPMWIGQQVDTLAMYMGCICMAGWLHQQPNQGEWPLQFSKLLLHHVRVEASLWHPTGCVKYHHVFITTSLSPRLYHHVFITKSSRALDTHPSGAGYQEVQ